MTSGGVAVIGRSRSSILLDVALKTGGPSALAALYKASLFPLGGFSCRRCLLIAMLYPGRLGTVALRSN